MFTRDAQTIADISKVIEIAAQRLHELRMTKPNANASKIRLKFTSFIIWSLQGYAMLIKQLI